MNTIAPPLDAVAADPGAHARALYRQRAGIYDLELAAFEPIRQAAIERLGLQTGQIVLDVGCGTGLSFAPLLRGVGPRGHVIGIDQSPDMLERARQRIDNQGWRNVRLVEASAGVAPIGLQADAAFLHFTHDIVRSPKDLAHLCKHLRPGASVVATGLKWAAPWLWPVNAYVLSAALYSTSSLEGLTAPWSELAPLLDDLQVSSTLLDGGYIASGRLRVS